MMSNSGERLHTEAGISMGAKLLAASRERVEAAERDFAAAEESLRHAEDNAALLHANLDAVRAAHVSLEAHINRMAPPIRVGVERVAEAEAAKEPEHIAAPAPAEDAEEAPPLAPIEIPEGWVYRAGYIYPPCPPGEENRHWMKRSNTKDKRPWPPEPVEEGPVATPPPDWDADDRGKVAQAHPAHVEP